MFRDVYMHLYLLVACHFNYLCYFSLIVARLCFVVTILMTIKEFLAAADLCQYRILLWRKELWQMRLVS